MLSNQTELPQLLTVPEFAKRLGVCRRTIERLMAAHAIRSCKVRGARRIVASELVRFVASAHEPLGGKEGAA